MKALWDRYPELPYHASAPWPYIEHNGQWDWIDSVQTVEEWLDQCVGRHWVEWTWDCWTLHNNYWCGVAFARERDSVLFLLKWS